MGKKLGGVSWRSVTLEGVPLDGASLDGFLGLEECCDYDLDSENKGQKKQSKSKDTQKQPASKERLQNISSTKVTQVHSVKTQEPAAKKIKLSNGFIVEDVPKAKPSINHSTSPSKAEAVLCGRNKKNKTKVKLEHKNEVFKNEGDALEENKLTLEDMQAWEQFQVPDEILKALAEQGFEKPTKIQELCLPPAMLGRRDILGAAETGSGKTLAFGIPILAGIMKLKDKEQSGQDVYDLKFKKSSVKRRQVTEKKKLITKRKKHRKSQPAGNKFNKETISDVEKVSHSSADDDENESIDNDDLSDLNENDKAIESDCDDIAKESGEGTQVDSDDNYLHLSDMIDSDDLADSSDEEKDQIIDPNASDDDIDEAEENDDELESSEEDVNAEQVGDGIGCVKVIDNIELPAPRIVKTGKPLYGLIITPTRELAMQISKHLTAAAKYTGIRVVTLVGGMAQVKQERLLSHSPELVVCTPGRLWQLLQQGNAHLAQVDSVKFLAIDETDRMVERNHFDELQPLLERLNADEKRRDGRQNFVMSATLTMTHDLPSHLKGKKVTKRGKIINKKVQPMTPQQKTKKLITMLGMTDPKIVDLTTDNHGKSSNLTECRITCALDQKDCYLYYILRTHPGRTIVFCNSIGCVKRLANLFALLKCRPLPLHAGMPQRQRLKNLERFHNDPRGVLVATDVAARGLDIPNVEHVIHYQVPRTAENYIHRSGRTARANKEGLTILMMEPGEALLYSKLCRTLNKTCELPTLPVPERVLASLRDCVVLARGVEAAALAGGRRAREVGWLEKAARECDLVIDEDFVPMKKKLDSQDGDMMARELQMKKKQLEALLAKPIFPKGFSYKYPTLNDPNALVTQEENALEMMKKVLETKSTKKEKRTSKNAPLLNLEKKLQPKKKELSKKSGRVVKKKFYKK